MHTPLVSICIPTFQRADRLKETLESILSQTMEDYEIVIADNCSSDHTEEIAGSFQDSRIHFFRNERNIGAAMNHNRCLLEAKGMYIKFMHSDDRFVNPTALEQFLDVAKRHPEVGLITCGYTFADREKPWLRPGDIKRSKGFPSVRESMTVHNIGLPSEWFFHRKLLDSTGFLINAHTCDCDFVMKALYYYDSYTIAEPLIEHRLDGGNETYIANRLNGWEAMRFKAFPHLPYYSELTMEMKAAISNYLHMSVMNRVLSSIWNESYHLCVQGVLDLLKLDPHLMYFQGEDRHKLLLHLLDLLVDRARPYTIFEFVFNQTYSRPYSDLFRYGYGLHYQLYSLQKKLQTTGKQLAVHGNSNYFRHFELAFPELKDFIRLILNDTAYSTVQENKDLAVFADQSMIDKKDTFLLLAGNNESIHLMRYWLTKQGWIEGEHYLPVLENL